MTARVLFDARLVLERPTGIGRYVVSLLPALSAAAPACEFHVLRRPDPWPGYEFATLASPNVFHHVSRERHMSLTQNFTVPRLATRLGADVIHYPHFDAPVVFGRVPVVANIHDVKYLTLRGLFRRFDGLKSRYLQHCLGLTARHAAAIISLSAATQSDVRSLLAPCGLLRVVPAAADRSFRPAPPAAVAAFRSRCGIERPYVLCVGEFRPHKNHEELIRAFAASKAAATHDLVLVGQRHRDDTPPETYAAAAGIATRVRVLTNISSEDLVAAYTGADVFVLVSLHEGFGLPILEAMACGAPSIVSRTTAAGEVAGNAALLVDPTNGREIVTALDRLVSEEATAERYRALGFDRAREFTWEAAARGTLAVYDEVLATRSVR